MDVVFKKNSPYFNPPDKKCPNAPCFAACVSFVFPGLEIGQKRVRMCAGGRRSAESGRSDPFLRGAGGN